MEIVTFNPIYTPDFYSLNIEWLVRFFYVEPYDEEVLSKPEKYIIRPGGQIFFAIQDGNVIGTVALLKRDTATFELTKMAVNPAERGKKIGQKLLTHCIEFAKENCFESLYLYSNTKLENAIYIYRKLGFKEIDVPKNNPYKRSNIKMTYPLHLTTFL